MAIAFDAANAAAGNSVSFTIGGGSDRILIVGITSESSTYTDVTYNSVSGNKLDETVGSESFLEFWYFLEAELPVAGSYTLAAVGGGTDSEAIGGQSWTGVDQTTPFGSTFKQADVVTIDVTGTANDEVVVDTFVSKDHSALSAGPLQDERYNQAGDGEGDVSTAGSSEPGNGGTVTMSWTATGNASTGIIAVAMKPAAAAAGDIDTAEKRKSVSGIWLPLIAGVTPNSGKDAEWRWEAGWNYSGRAPAGATTKTTSLEAVLQKQLEISASLNAGVQKQFTRTASADAAVAALNTKTADLEAAVQATVTRTLGLQATVQKTLTRTASLHAGVSMAMTLTASLAAALELARNVSAQADAALAGTVLLGAGLDASLGLLIAPAGTRTFGHTEDRDHVVTAGERNFGHTEDRDQVVTVGGRTFVVPAGNRKH